MIELFFLVIFFMCLGIITRTSRKIIRTQRDAAIRDAARQYTRNARKNGGRRPPADDDERTPG